MKQHNYYVYIITNHTKTVLYTGVTDNIGRRLHEHFENRGDAKTFAGRYHCYSLLYYERFQYIHSAIDREKEIKNWSRARKVALIETENPGWIFLNDQL